MGYVEYNWWWQDPTLYGDSWFYNVLGILVVLLGKALIIVITFWPFFLFLAACVLMVRVNESTRRNGGR